MQEAHIKLKEILWEITDECHNGCSYCGSSDILNCDKPTVYDIKQIADRIAEYPPEELNITGGDPLLVDYSTHDYIVNKLGDTTTMKILVNPKSLKNISVSEPTIEECILGLYDRIGVSINTLEELDIFKSKWEFLRDYPITIITNFNIGNIFQYSDIEAFVYKNLLPWQVQYTMYKGESDLAIYSNPDAKEVLFKRISTSINKGVKIVLADNLTNGPCVAGKYSLGILSSGDIIPCLSFRAWKDDCIVIGNIKSHGLQDIWEERFGKFRCNKFECCKDHINAPYEAPLVQSSITISNPNGPTTWLENKPTKFPSEQVIMYGIFTPQPSIEAYGVYDVGSTYVYGVTTWKNNSGQIGWGG